MTYRRKVISKRSCTFKIYKLIFKINNLHKKCRTFRILKLTQSTSPPTGEHELAEEHVSLGAGPHRGGQRGRSEVHPADNGSRAYAPERPAAARARGIGLQQPSRLLGLRHRGLLAEHCDYDVAPTISAAVVRAEQEGRADQERRAEYRARAVEEPELPARAVERQYQGSVGPFESEEAASAGGCSLSSSQIKALLFYFNRFFMELEVSMRASHAVSWADQILHVHFKSTNHND